MVKKTKGLVPLNTNTFLIVGPSHKNGGVDIAPGIEAEGGEILKAEGDQLRFLSKHKLGIGESPAQNFLRGMSFDGAYGLQEGYKDIHRLNDDGSKYRNGGNPLSKIKNYATYMYNKLFSKSDAPQTDIDVDFDNIKTTNNRPYNSDSLKYIYSKIRNSNLTPMQQSVMLATILEESGGNENAIDKTNTFKGLIQWAPDRYDMIPRKEGVSELDSQIDYLLTSINNTNDKVSWTHGGKGSGYKSYKEAIKDWTSDNIESAMKGFTLGFVRPTGKKSSSANRLKVAQQIYDRINTEQNTNNEQNKNNEQKVNGGKTLTNTIKDMIKNNKYQNGGEFDNNNDSKTNDKEHLDLDLILPYLNLRIKRAIREFINAPSPIVQLVNRGRVGPNFSTDIEYFKLAEKLLNKPNNESFEVNDSTRRKKELKYNGGEMLANALKINPIASGIGAGVDILGNWIGYGINANMLKKLQAPSKPVEEEAVKLKTSYNVNPQLSSIRESLAGIERGITGNTASSQLAQYRAQQARNKALGMTNQLFGQKENIETQLINQDIAQQAATRGRNVASANAWMTNLTNFKNNLIEKRSEALNSAIQGTAGAIGNLGSNISRTIGTGVNTLTTLYSTPEGAAIAEQMLEALGMKKCGGKVKIKR